MTLRDQIAEQALMLPPEDRAYLVDLLEESLPKSGFATPELAAQWLAEVNRRLEAYDRGEARSLDIDSAMQSMRSELEQRRSGSAR